MKVTTTLFLLFIFVLVCESIDLNVHNPELQKFFDSLDPEKKIELKKDSKSILKDYLNEKKHHKQKQKLKVGDSKKVKNKEKTSLATAGKNVVGLMQQVEKLIKKSIKVSDKTVPINIDFNAIDFEPIASTKSNTKKNELPKRSNSNYNSAPSRGGYNSAPSGGGYNSAPSGGGYNSAPSGSGYNSAPSGGGYNVASTEGSYNKAPVSSYPGSGYGNSYYQQQIKKPYGTLYDKDYKEPIIIEHKPLKFVPKEHPKKKHKVKNLELHDYKSIWLQMIFNVYKLMENKHYMKNDDTNFKTMKLLFKTLKGTSILPSHKRKHECPYSYDTAGSLCLSAEYLHETLTYQEARQYCQLIKGGDLVIIRSACEFREVVEYLEEIDPYRTKNYWIGANDEYHEGHWTNIDGSIFPLGAPFWGKVMEVMEPSGSDPVVPGKEDYGMMMGADFFYVHDVSNNQGTALHGIPLCQYVHQRDRFHKDSEKPKGWGPYASYNDWKKHKQNNIFDNYFGYDNHHVKPENPFEEYGHFNYKPPEEDFTSEEEYIRPYAKPTEDNNPYEGEGPYEENYYSKPENEYKPISSEVYSNNYGEKPYKVLPETYPNKEYGSYKPIGSEDSYVQPPDGEYSNNYGEKPYKALPETYPNKEHGSYKPTNEGYYGGYDQAHLENEYLESIPNSYGDHDSGFPNNIYQGPFYPSNHENYGNSNSNPNQQGSYINVPNQIPINPANYGNSIGYPNQHGSIFNGYVGPNQTPNNQENYVNPISYPSPQGGSTYGGMDQYHQYSNQGSNSHNSYQKSNAPLGIAEENYKNRLEIYGNTTMNNDLYHVYNSQIQPPHNFPILSFERQNIKGNTQSSNMQNQEANTSGYFEVPISHFRDQQIGVNGMLSEPVASLVSNNPYSSLMIQDHSSIPNVNSSMVPPNYYFNNQVSTSQAHDSPQYPQLNPGQRIEAYQNPQLSPLQIIQTNQNPQINPVQMVQTSSNPQLNPLQLIQSDRNPTYIPYLSQSSIGLVNPISFQAKPTQVNQLGSPQVLHNNYNLNYAHPSHNPATSLQQTPGVLFYDENNIPYQGNNMQPQGSRDQILVVQGNSHLQRQSSSVPTLPQQYYVGNTLIKPNDPSLHDKIQDNLNGQSLNGPFSLASTVSSEKHPHPSQIYVISSPQLPNRNHPHQVLNSGANYGGSSLSSPVQIMSANDFRSLVSSPELFMENNQVPQTLLINNPNVPQNYQLLTQSNHPPSTATFHPSIYSSHNEETSLPIPQSLSPNFSPTNDDNIEKRYRDDFNFPERFSEAVVDEGILLDDSPVQPYSNSTID